MAEACQGEIVNCDAMQAYREVRIASNKPAPLLLNKVHHHLLDAVSVTEEFDVAAYFSLALQKVEEICGRGKIPVITGGSGMYVQVLLDGIFDEGTKDPDVRRRLEARCEQEGNAKVYAELRQVDPQAAGKIHPHDRRRIVRALEVYQTAQQPISRLQKSRQGMWGRYDIEMFGLNRPRTELYERINARVDEMVSAGLVEEVQRILAAKMSPTARKMIGFPEISGYLRGEYDLDRAQYLVKMHTRHFAKRQMTWFRKESRIRWIDVRPKSSAEDIAQSILLEWQNKKG